MKKHAVLAVALCSAMSITAFADSLWDWPAFSPPEETLCSISVQQGSPLEFTPRGLELLLGLEDGELTGMTITGLPEKGSLVLEGVALEEFSRLDREEIGELCLVLEEDAGKTSFSFIPDSRRSVPATVEVQVTEAPEAPPLTSDTVLDTFSGVAAWKLLPVSGEDEDSVRIQITKAPEFGSLSIEGKTVRYLPYPGFTGKDRFTYTARSGLGPFSDEAAVEVSVLDNESGVSFLDMSENPTAYTAIRLHQAGVLCGEQVGQNWFFHPERPMTRGEFLTALMAASGLDRELSACMNTGLKNDDALPLWAKPYLKAALAKGIVKEENFPWEETLTRAEAVVFTHRASDIDDVKSYPLSLSDKEDIPTWAVYSYQNLAAHQLLTFYSDSSQPNQTLTRADAAELLWQLYCHRLGKK